MSSKIYFICFADSRLQKSINRLKNEVKDFKMIDEVYFYTEKDFDPYFKKEFHPIRHLRGYGYWKWKPYFVKKIFDQINVDDIVIWSDVGNIFNIRGEQRFKEYLNMVRKNKTGILYFRQEGNVEKLWTKGDLFKFFNVYEDPAYTDSYQAWAGCFILRKTDMSQQLVDRWYDIHMNHYDLTTDKRSQVPNLSGFRENRHDQSVFSLLVKSYDSIQISSTEVYGGEKGWKTQVLFPIWGARKKEFKGNKITKKIETYYKWFYRKYLIFFENMHIDKLSEW